MYDVSCNADSATVLLSQRPPSVRGKKSSVVSAAGCINQLLLLLLLLLLLGCSAS